MTPTALRALTVAALSAAITLTTLQTAAQAGPVCDPPSGQMGGCPVIECPAETDLVYDEQGTPRCKPWSEDKGDPESDPNCPEGTEHQGEFGCVAVQLPEEKTGGYRCPDQADTYPCDVSTAPESPGAIQEPMADGYVAVGEPAPGDTRYEQPGDRLVPDDLEPAVPVWAQMDKIMEWLRAVLGPLFCWILPAVG